MKPSQKVSKSPYNPSVKLRAEIIPQKLSNPKKKQSTPSESQTESESSSYDSEVQDFTNQFYDQALKKVERSLEEKKDNQTKTSQQNQDDKQKAQEIQKNNQKQTQIDKLSLKIKNIKENIKDLDLNALLFKKKDQNRLKQIASFLSQKHKEKRDFRKKLKKIKNSQKQRKKIEQEMNKKQQQQQHTKRVKQIRNLSLMIKQKIEKKKQQEESKLQEIQNFYEKFHKKYNNRKLYKLMEQSSKKRMNQQVQKQNEILRERKKALAQVVTSQEIIELNKRRQEVLKDIERVKLAEKQQKYSQIAEKNRQLRERIYISNKYLQMQEESERRQKIKQIPKEKLKKIKNYQQYVKQNFLPNRSEEGQQNEAHKQEQQESEIVEIDGKLYKKVKRNRYLKGVKVGQIVQNVPLPKTQKEVRMLGISYLQHLKQLPKKRHSTSLDLSRKSEPEERTKAITSRIEIPKVPKSFGKISLPKNPTRYEIQNLISSLKVKDELISRKQHYLKMVNRDLSGTSPEKSALDEDMLDNIEKKINLLGKL